MSWFEKDNSQVYKDFAYFAQQVVKFNTIAGKERDPEFQLKLCEEEAQEVVNAYDKQDKAGFLKEVCDLFVVASYGVEDGDTEECYFVDQWAITDVATLAPYVNSLDNMYKSTCPEDDLLSFLYTATDMLQIVDADWQGAMREVCRSNMSKFSEYHPKCIEEYDAHCNTLMADGRYTGVTWDLKDGFVIWKADTGKILKGYDYSEADVSGFVN